MPNNCDGKNFREIVDKIRADTPQLTENKKEFFLSCFSVGVSGRLQR
jgi:hypothetical protein